MSALIEFFLLELSSYIYLLAGKKLSGETRNRILSLRSSTYDFAASCLRSGVCVMLCQSLVRSVWREQIKRAWRGLSRLGRTHYMSNPLDTGGGDDKFHTVIQL